MPQKPVESTQKNEQPKLSYEQLNDACNQLFQQNQALRNQIQQMNQMNMFKRLDYLFKVLEFNRVFNDQEFINSCVAEIKEAMIIPEEPKEEKPE